jgi:hypothetical protein
VLSHDFFPLCLDQPARRTAFPDLQDLINFSRLKRIMKDNLRGAVAGKDKLPKFN